MTKMLSAPGGFAPWPGALPLDPAGGSAPRPPLYARAPHSPLCPPQPLTPSAAYESNWTLPRYLKPKAGAYASGYWQVVA